MPAVTVTKQIHFSMRNRGRREIREGPMPVPDVTDEGRVPRVIRLMALAIKIDDLIASGAIADQAEAARLGHVTRARMTQIMNLLLLAPDIQEAILNLPRVKRGRDPIVETHMRPIAAEVDWERQRAMWQARDARPRLPCPGVPLQELLGRHSVDHGSGHFGRSRPRACPIDRAATSHTSSEIRWAIPASSTETSISP